MAGQHLFDRPALEVAPLLLGAVITGRGVSVRLTEVEAYQGSEDPGSHAFRGRTPRNATMFGPSGRFYVYRSYGIHACMNLVCSPAGTATAVLLRAGEVVDGADLARQRRGLGTPARNLARGPGNLTVALGVTLDDDGAEFPLELPAAPLTHFAGPRVGVSGVGGTDEFPWRFWIPGEPTVSAYRPGEVLKGRG